MGFTLYGKQQRASINLNSAVPQSDPITPGPERTWKNLRLSQNILLTSFNLTRLIDPEDPEIELVLNKDLQLCPLLRPTSPRELARDTS